MLIQVRNRVRKIGAVGPRAAMRVLRHRQKIQSTIKTWKKNSNWWSLIPASHRAILQQRCLELYDRASAHSYGGMSSLYLTEGRKSIIAQANQYLVSYTRPIPWNSDTRLLATTVHADASFDQATFFSEYVFSGHQGSEYGKDIRVVWQLSRFQYLPVLARAYRYTHELQYLQKLVELVDDWITSNRFLYGPHWVNGMEVAIRVLNWIAAFEYIKHDSRLDEAFKRKLITSLYQHMLYLEHMWEYYDSRTNNHYVANLVGYLYLTKFFSSLSGCKAKFTWCVAELLAEFEKQIFQEGTSYEGSTQYHQLTTELFYLAYVLLQSLHLTLERSIVEKLQRMIGFLVWCTPYKGSLITIGDHDSGSVMREGISYQKLAHILHMLDENNPVQVKRFDQFGLSIIKTPIWHITLRHHAYHPRQPSGHFHNDVGSITLSYNGIPILVDPGSYVYTASTEWRNRFRSTRVHNSCGIVGQEQVPFNDDLFSLDIPAGQSIMTIFQETTVLGMSGEHQLYKRYGISFERAIQLDLETNTMHISDVCKSKIKQQSHLIGWNFTLAPELEVHRHESGQWIISHHAMPLFAISSPQISFMVSKGYVSPEYGIKQPTQCLSAAANMKIDIPYSISFRLLTA